MWESDWPGISDALPFVLNLWVQKKKERREEEWKGGMEEGKEGGEEGRKGQREGGSLVGL